MIWTYKLDFKLGCQLVPGYSGTCCCAISRVVKLRTGTSQVKFRLLHERLERLGSQPPADTAATETYYIKEYYNLEETIKVQISKQRRVVRQNNAKNVYILFMNAVFKTIKRRAEHADG